ncbi:unnamed protein product [Protopolystoma xenopodis]|uniref:Uncharacterized protein n=1 Tax=Protopolystoma xenopodis TaxID=117903 RepID=A0A448WJC6_9PLAT|nr:unnamed protein product [Protopolystoma xenopodis]
MPSPVLQSASRRASWSSGQTRVSLARAPDAWANQRALIFPTWGKAVAVSAAPASDGCGQNCRCHCLHLSLDSPLSLSLSPSRSHTHTHTQLGSRGHAENVPMLAETGCQVVQKRAVELDGRTFGFTRFSAVRTFTTQARWMRSHPPTSLHVSAHLLPTFLSFPCHRCAHFCVVVCWCAHRLQAARAPAHASLSWRGPLVGSRRPAGIGQSFGCRGDVSSLRASACFRETCHFDEWVMAGVGVWRVDGPMVEMSSGSAGTRNTRWKRRRRHVLSRRRRNSSRKLFKSTTPRWPHT